MRLGLVFLLLVLLLPPLLALSEESAPAPTQIPNPMIDSGTFLSHVQESHKLRLKRRLSEAQFIEMAKERGTVILDARSAERFKQMHIVGAKSLPFTEMTEATLSALVPSKETRILIYCNNNVENSPIAFATKAPPASLNLSTYTALYSYGYKNVYELGPVIDPANSEIKFEGALAD